MHAKLVSLKAPSKLASQETIQELEWLLAQAKSGSLTGIAYTAMHFGGSISCNVKGRSRLIPLFTLGAVETLKVFVCGLIK